MQFSGCNSVRVGAWGLNPSKRLILEVEFWTFTPSGVFRSEKGVILIVHGEAETFLAVFGAVIMVLVYLYWVSEKKE
jgi:hypothetical protein